MVQAKDIQNLSKEEKIAFSSSWIVSGIVFILLFCRLTGLGKNNQYTKGLLGFTEGAKSHKALYLIILIFSVLCSVVLTVDF